MERKIVDFLNELASKEPTPGGGGASALLGGVGIALESMVANLTKGKKKYAEYEEDIVKILEHTDKLLPEMLELIKKDAEVFEPLAKAYSIPKDTEGRDEKLDEALKLACTVPVEIVEKAYEAIDILEELAKKGSRLAISDVAVAASAIRAALCGGVVNVYINTKLMKDRTHATTVNAYVEEMKIIGTKRCDAVYDEVTNSLISQ